VRIIIVENMRRGFRDALVSLYENFDPEKTSADQIDEILANSRWATRKDLVTALRKKYGSVPGTARPLSLLESEASSQSQATDYLWSQEPEKKQGGSTRKLNRNPQSFLKRFQQKDIRQVLRILRCANICNGACMIVLYPLGFLTQMISFNLTFGFFAVYCCGFALLLICFECNIGPMQVRLRKNFGFMFTFAGRTIFLLFIASICFASSSSDWIWGNVLGVITVANALFNCAILATHPTFKKGGKLNWMSDPSQSYTGAGEEVQNVIITNPSIARRALQSTANIIVDNPGLNYSIV